MPLSTSGSLLLSSVNSEFFPNDNPVNQFNWYNKMTYGTANGYSPVVSGSDPNVQIQMSNSTADAGGYIYQNNVSIQNANQFVFTWDMFVNNTGSGDFINLYFGSNSANTVYGGNATNGMTFNFQLYPGGTGNTTGIYLYQNTTTVPSAGAYTNHVARSTNTIWATNTWVNCMVVYQKGTIGTWNLYINGVNVISYNDPTNAGWLTQTGNVWGFQLYNGGATFTSYLRNLNLSTNLPFSVVNSYNWYTNMITVNSASTYTPVQSGTDPNVQLQLSNGASTFNLQDAYVYSNFPVQNYGSFTLTFQFYLASGYNANGFYVSVGNQTGITPYNSNLNSNKYSIYFNTWAGNPIGGTGIYLLNNTHQSYIASNYLATAAVTWTTNAWNTVVINYSRNTSETWKVSYNGTSYITYNGDTLNQKWVTELAGNYWIIGSTSNVQTFYIRQVNMVVTPSSGGNSQKLLTPLNWYTKMTRTQGSGNAFTPVQVGPDPNVQIQMSTQSFINNTNTYSITQTISSVNSMSFSCEYYFTGAFNHLTVYFGTTSNTTNFTSTNGGFYFSLLPYDNTVSIRYNGTVVATISITMITNSWIPLTIIYNKGTTNTWVINHNGTIGAYSDTNNTSWVSSAGTNIGVGAESGGGQTLAGYFRKIQLSYTPTSTLSFSSLSGIAPGIGNTGGSTGISYSQLRGKTGLQSGLNSNCVLATDQGAYNSNTTYISSFTTDTSARIIQLYGQANNRNNQANTRHLLQQTYTNTTNAVINATMTMSCQDFCKVYQNKILIYPDFQVDAQMFTFQVILDLGVNLFEFVCWKNNNALGGFIYTLINNSGGAVLMRSDNNSASALTNTSKITLTSTPAQVGPLDRIPSNYNCSGAYALVKLKAYPGSNLPVCQVRRSSDNATGNIYADWQGNLIYGNGYAGYPEGTSLANWLNGATGYVTIWYDQSGTGNNATQPTNGLQPALVWNTSGNAWTVDTQNSSSQRLNIPSNTLPVSTTDAQYSMLVKHGILRRTNYGGFIGAGVTTTNNYNELAYQVSSNTYLNVWWANDFASNFGTVNTAGNTIAVTYDGYGNRYGYLNSSYTGTKVSTGLNTTAGQQYIGYSANTGYMNGQLYHVYIFKSNLGQYSGSGTSINAIQDTSTITTLSNTLAYTSPLPNPCLNQVPVLDSITTTTKAACRGAYALVRLSLSYTGATVNLRRGLDNATSDFYADIQGNLNTAINNTGTSLANWLQGTIGYVTVWYDQSGNGNNATQATDANQPVISPFSMYPANDVNYLVDTQNSSTQFLNIPSGTIPVGTTNAPYSFVLRHGVINNTTNGALISGGIWANSQSNIVRASGDVGNGYYNYWFANDFPFGTAGQRVTGNQIAITYNGSAQNAYFFTNNVASATHTGGTTAAGQQYLFRSPGGEYLNGQMYYCYIFNIAIPDIDRLKLMTI